ncbi:hypothetical protein DUNSADRAFT_12 [Dunaliella salina]|uniref:EF-hand domain-containing protein n=1 Tax=Dunaliella salina TaxID=3046 RepID=A0ABQ7HAL2_DUNSA|nr:hypothetical protein DUNSADRAFT_12 [Dunaliella salina]|eukprot:KAF5843890.1 hypothetical protein DUNSADRAFT_12 [Dunaliella salina]
MSRMNVQGVPALAASAYTLELQFLKKGQRLCPSPQASALTTDAMDGCPSDTNLSCPHALQSRPKAAFATHARNTNPVDPRYKLASCQPMSTGPNNHTPSSNPSTSTKALRDTMQIRDIEGSSPAPYKQNQAHLRNSLDVKDIEGATVGWKPPFRSHVGVRLRDPGLDVSDINGKMSQGKLGPRRPDDPLVWTTGTLTNAAAPSVAHALGATAAQKANARPASAGARLNDSANGTHNIEFTGLPVFQLARPREGTTSAPTFGDLHAKCSRREVRDQQRVASALATMQQRNAARIDARVYMAQQERRRRNNAQAHQLRVQVADEHRAARKAGEEAAAALGDCIANSQKDVGALYHAWQARDREACGKLTSAEFGQAMHALHLQVSPQVLTDLVRGLADAAGLVPYRELSRAMVRRTIEKQRRDSARREPSSSLSKQHPQQHPQQQPYQAPPTAGAVVSAPELLPPHAFSSTSAPPEALSKPAWPSPTNTAPVSTNNPAHASTPQPAQFSNNNNTSTPAPQTGLLPGGSSETGQAAQPQRNSGGATAAEQEPLQPGEGGVATSRHSAEGTAVGVAASRGAAKATTAAAGTGAVVFKQGNVDRRHQALSGPVPLQHQQENSRESAAVSVGNHLKTAPDLQAVVARPRSAQGASPGSAFNHGGSNVLSPRKSAQAWGANGVNIERPGSSRPPTAFRQSQPEGAALEAAQIEAAVQAGIAPPGAQVLGPDGAKYFTFKGRTYWFAGNEPDSNFAQASKDFKPTREGPRPGGRNHLISQPPAPYFDAPLAKGVTLEPSSIGQREVSNGLQAAKPGGGSLGATLYHEAGHGPMTFLAPPAYTHPKMRSLSARGHKRPGNPQNPLSSSITSVANAGAGPSMQRLEKATMRDELRAVRLLC